MKAKKEFKVIPKLPGPLAALGEMAYNLAFSYQSEIRDLFQRIDPKLWQEGCGNPVNLLSRVGQERLDYLANDPGFLSQLEATNQRLTHYLNSPTKEDSRMCVAYFSAEFGLASCLPIYSGGLGILAGDHLKSASDLNIPLIGVGLLYQEGYFSQYLNTDGWQMERYPNNDFEIMPIRKVTGEDGHQLVVTVLLKGQPVNIGVWRVQVGRTPLFLLDTDLNSNTPELRSITARLYGGDRENRIRQEIVLGIGGVRALHAMNTDPTVIHMNEGHSAFSALERINILRRERGLSFDEARELVQATTVFTTHTPVPAGNDTFDPELARPYFEDYTKDLGLNWRALLGYGRINPRDENEPFGVTPLSLRLSAHANGVSRLHGRVSRHMWQNIWPKNPVEDVPIDSITNGIHVPTWASNEMSRLYGRQLGADWAEDPDSKRVWEQVQQIPLSELWRAHTHCRESLIAFTRRTLFKQLKTRGSDAQTLKEAMSVLNPDHLTIGFARRFAVYKRATLLFRDPDRLAAILNHPQRPIQVIIAGKAHPQDNEGKAFIKEIIHLSQESRFKNRVVFLEDYNIFLGSLLVSGCDVWLNNPRRPLEACGTSGMKALANGVLNLSVLDGWWDEGYQPEYGWAIGKGESYDHSEVQDNTESQDLYNLLENQVAPLFYQRAEDGLPVAWCEMMRKSIRDLVPVFNAHRMVQDYLHKYYRPCSQRYQELTANDMAGAKALALWRQKLMTSWTEVQVLETGVNGQKTNIVGDIVELTAKVSLGQLSPEDVTVSGYYGPMSHQGDFTDRETLPLKPELQNPDGSWEYRGQLICKRPGNFGYTVRVTPSADRLENPMMYSLISWA